MSRQTIYCVGIVGKMRPLHLNVTGQYVVHLPDCRTQIVDYFVDEYKQVCPTLTSINMLMMN